MDQPSQPLADEFRKLASHLKEALHLAWESPERRNLQAEIEAGLEQVGAALREAAERFSESEAGAKIKAELEDLGQRIRSGELEEKARSDLLRALQSLNAELDKAMARWREGAQSGGSGRPEI